MMKVNKKIARYSCPGLLLVLFFGFSIKGQDFAKGADIGWLSQMESSGIKFYNNGGIEQNCIQILKDKGINSIRLRVWVNPTNGWSGTSDVVAQAVRAKSMGMRIMIDFHYSDSWADPGKQNKPAAWVAQDFNTLLTSVYNHTFNVLTSLKANGVTPEWVQVGNETNNGMLWEDGKASVSMSNFARLVASGYDAVKAVDSTSKVIVHISNGYDNSLFRWLFDGLKNNGGKWDVIGMSLYPTQSDWANLNSQCLTNMIDMVARYQKEVMICEVGMDVGPAPTVKAFLCDLISKTKNLANGKGLGVFYWEPQSYNKWQGYNKGAFDLTGKPTVAMDAFLENPPPAPVTNFLLNPGFDTDEATIQTPASWNESGAVSASYTSTGNGWNPNGSYFLNHYEAAAYQVRTFQTVSVPNGRYSVSAWAIRGNGQVNCQIYATGFGGSDLSANIPFNDAWSEIKIPEIEVTNGQITIGVWSDANAGNWLNIDSVTLSNLTTLPVSLISYNASLQSNGQVKLTWKTPSEENNKSYIIQRSPNGINYTEIGKVQGNGTVSHESGYTFTDFSPLTGSANYYRLIQIDLDGKSTILGIKILKVSLRNVSLSIYPNPIGKSIVLKYPAWIGKKITMQLTGIDGKKVFSKEFKPIADNISIELPVIQKGQYFIYISGDTINETQKIIIE